MALHDQVMSGAVRSGKVWQGNYLFVAVVSARTGVVLHGMTGCGRVVPGRIGSGKVWKENHPSWMWFGHPWSCMVCRDMIGWDRVM